MKKLKRLLCIGLAIALAASCAACGPSLSNEDANKAPGDTSKAVSESGGEKITLRIMDSSDSTQKRRKVFNEEFMQRHPNITVEYTMMAGDQAKTTLVTAIKSGTAPDLFPLVTGMKLDTAVSEGWYMPMNEYLPEGFLDTFDKGALNEGITTLDKKTYVLPEDMNIVNSLMFYNKKLFKEAGLDPENPPKTWSQFIDANKKITKVGKGKYYGMIEGAKSGVRNEIAVRAFSSLAGSKSNDIGIISLVGGKNVLNSQAMKDAFGLYKTLVDEGCFHPDSVNISPPEARALFAQDQAAFIVQGSWCIPVWRSENPNLDFGVMSTPVPDGGAKGSLPYIAAQPWMGIYAKSAHPKAAGLYLSELYAEDYQGKVVSDGGFISTIKGINEKYMSNDSVMKKYYDLSQTAGKLAPDPLIGNKHCATVYTQVKEISPNLGQILQGVISGSIKDYSSELDKLAAVTQTEWEGAIKTAASTGVDVSAADFEFKNWDPMKDYTAADYSNHK